MRRLLIRLYPAAWRQRYGDELEALMADAPGGMSAYFDLIKGAITMRWNALPAWTMLSGLLIAGGLAGLSLSYLIPQKWEARAALQITPVSASHVSWLLAQLMSRASLTTLVLDPKLDLYRAERRTQPLESVIDEFRRNTHLSVLPERKLKSQAQVFTIGFTDSDPEKAVAVTNALISRLLRIETSLTAKEKDRALFYLDVLDPPRVPKQPSAPKRAVFALLGLLAGLIVFVLVRICRPTSPAGPTLRTA
jgi:LPS O-antigen subunit length determinant protein (WzzB/FepE family)